MKSKELTSKQIVKILEENNIKPENLEDTIHQAASSLASVANNNGLVEQIRFLKNTCGWDTQGILINAMDENIATEILFH